jgi:AcrR family transcriptional regulator
VLEYYQAVDLFIKIQNGAFMSFQDATIQAIAKPRNDKRSRLVDAANQLFHEQGVSNTTLAMIADLAKVPLGNVYYYFKSKESIVLAVIEYRRKLLQKELEELNTVANAKDRLHALVQKLIDRKEHTANYGDALGTLCQELSKQGGKIAEASSALMLEMVNWCAAQFKAAGQSNDATKLAYKLVSSLQGLSILTLTFRNPSFLAENADGITAWLNTI